jgi:hypothetical protein
LTSRPGGATTFTQAGRELANLPLPVEFSREHELITRMLVQINRGVARKYFPIGPFSTNLSFVMLYVIIGHCERRPVTVSKLARATGLSRPTTL